MLGVLAWLSAGSAGAERLSSVGPVGWQVGLVAALEMSLVAAVVAWESHRRQWDGRVRMPAAVRERLARRRD
jgi:membrane protein implicated in regulation of membrane protease activity